MKKWQNKIIKILIRIGNFLIFSSIVLILFIACENENKENESIEILNNGSYAFYYEPKENTIDFFFDILGDESNNLTGTWPDLDVYRIYVDYNDNEILDPEIDLMISSYGQGSICLVNLINQNTTTACSFEHGIIGESLFSSTMNSANEHVNYKVSVPKDLLSNGSSINIVIEVYDPETGWKYFPSLTPIFTDYFEVDW